MAAEIAEQPAQWRTLLADAGPELDAVAATIRRYDPHTVLLVARGTSDHAALYAKYLVEIRLGKAAGLVSPSTMTAYGARPDFRGVLMIAVSQSGGSPDLVRSLEVARDCGASACRSMPGLSAVSPPPSPTPRSCSRCTSCSTGSAAATAARPPGCPTSPTPCWNAAGRSPPSRPATASPSGW